MKRFNWEKQHVYWGFTAFFVIIASIVFFMAIERWSAIKATVGLIMGILSPIFWGLALSYILFPIQRLLENAVLKPLAERFFTKKLKLHQVLPRAVSIFLVLVSSIVLVVVLLAMLLPEIYSSLQSIVPNLTIYSRRLIRWADELLIAMPEVEQFVVTILGEASSTFTNWLRGSLLPQIEVMVSSLSIGVFAFIKGLINVFVGIVVACYVMYNRESFGANTKRMFYSFMPLKLVESFLKLSRNMNGAFTGFFMGKLLDSFIIGCICAIGCAIARIPYVALVSVIIGITNIIPFFGPFIGAIPCALIILMVSPMKCLVFIIFIIILQQLDGNVIGPKILGGATGLNGFWVLFAILVGGGLFGFLGMICGVPIFTVIYSAVNSLIKTRLEKRGLPTETEDYKEAGKIMERYSVLAGDGKETIEETTFADAMTNGDSSVPDDREL